jgi:hypothetical protein
VHSGLAADRPLGDLRYLVGDTRRGRLGPGGDWCVDSSGAIPDAETDHLDVTSIDLSMDRASFDLAKVTRLEV